MDRAPDRGTGSVFSQRARTMRATRRRAKTTVVAIFPLLGAGCGALGNDDVRTDSPLSGSDMAIGALVEDVFVVGGAAAPAWASFARVRSAAFAATGDLALLDGDQRRIVVVAPDGGLRREFAGPGPGELRRPRSLAVVGENRLFVYDAGHESLLEFGLDGNFVGQVRIAAAGGLPAHSIGSVVRALPDGRLLAIATADDGSGRSIDLISLEGSRETLYVAWEMPHEAPYTRSNNAQTDEGLRVTTLVTLVDPPRFAPRLLAAVISNGRVAVVDSVGYRVKLVSGAGAVEGALERPIQPFDVTPELEARVRDAEARGPVAIRGPGMSPEARMAIERRIRDHAKRMTFARQIPVIAAVAVDSEDRIWVGRTASDGFSRGPTDIFTADGNYLGTLANEDIRMPLAFGPDGLMAYVERDELGATVVRVIRLLALQS